MAPFLADKSAIQQGFVTSEPFKLEKAGAKLVVHLLARTAATPRTRPTIETSSKLVNEKPDVVQRFVNGRSRAGTYYVTATAPGQRAHQEGQPGDDRRSDRAQRRRHLKKYGIVDSGDADKLGIGAMSDARWKDFHATMVEAGLLHRRPRLSSAPSTLQFVNKKHAMSLKTGSREPRRRPAAERRQGVRQRRRRAARHLDLDVGEGEFSACSARPGCGKSHGAAHHRRARRALRRTDRMARRQRSREAAGKRRRLRVPGADADAVGDRVQERPACR